LSCGTFFRGLAKNTGNNAIIAFSGQLLRYLNSAGLVAKRLVFALTTAAEEDLAALGDFETDGLVFTAVAAVAEGQVLGVAAGAAFVGAGVEGDGDGHIGGVVGFWHDFVVGCLTGY